MINVVILCFDIVIMLLLIIMCGELLELRDTLYCELELDDDESDL